MFAARAGGRCFRVGGGTRVADAAHIFLMINSSGYLGCCVLGNNMFCR